MDSFTLEKLDFTEVKGILSRYCQSALGRALVKNLSPSRRPETVRRWLEETSQMVLAIKHAGPPPLASITDIREQLSRAKPGGGASGEDFAIIASTLTGAAAVKRWAEGLDENLNLIRELGAQMPDFQEEIEAIRSVIDSRGRVMDTASDTLNRIRRNIEVTRRRIHEIIYGYIRRPDVVKVLRNPTVTLHDDRFVLPVKVEFRNQLPGVVHRVSNTGATVFVEPNDSVELNNTLVELLNDERREIARLLDELSIRIHQQHSRIISLLRILARIDLIAAKAQYAYQFDFTSPEITERGGVELYQARHPLLIEQVYQYEITVPSERTSPPPHEVVPVDVRLGIDFDTLIITGPNTGGKTVTLKTVGLLSIMAQSGMHIPAQKGSKLPLFRDVLIDVGDEQSLQQSLSTFGAHIRRIKNILNRADKYSLVLLDELGAGTDPDEGAAIGQAILDELQRIGCLTMVTTHLSALKAYAFNHERVDNASVEFDTRTLRPLYRLRIGQPGESHAITVASAMGLSREIVSAAKNYLDEKGLAFTKAIRATSSARRASEAARARAHAEQIAAEQMRQEYEARLAELSRLQEKFHNWVASLAELKPGDEIQIPSLGKVGKLVRVEFNKQIALVDIGNMQMEVPLAELMPDVGQKKIREELASLREQILAQSRRTEQALVEAENLRKQYQQALSQQRARQEQFNRWIRQIAQAKPGQQVTISKPPGKGKLIELDFSGNKATVETSQGVLTLSLQELFPQSGVFASRRAARSAQVRKRQRDRVLDRPIQHRKPDGRAARANRKAVLETPPGEQLYIVPFRKNATLIRFEPEKDIAVLQAGAFEVEIPIADLEPERKRK